MVIAIASFLGACISGAGSDKIARADVHSALTFTVMETVTQAVTQALNMTQAADHMSPIRLPEDYYRRLWRCSLVKAIETAQNLDPAAVRETFNRLHIMIFFGEFKIDPATVNRSPT